MSADRFKNKYKTGSNRLQGYDYSQEGAYFVTICTKNRECVFGEISDDKVILSPMGSIVEEEWYKTPELRSYVVLGEAVIMPNHFHGIIFIDKSDKNTFPTIVETPAVETRGIVSLRQGKYKNKFGPQRHNLASIIRGLKSAITTRIKKELQTDFHWQANYYEHIIRNQESYLKIENYILNNPLLWKGDRFHTDNDKNLPINP